MVEIVVTSQYLVGITGTVMTFVVGTVTIIVDGTVLGITDNVTTTIPGDDLTGIIYVDGTLDGTALVGTRTGLDHVDGTVTNLGTLVVVTTVLGILTTTTGALVGKMLVGIDESGIDDGIIVVTAGCT
jgi:hypothetical protein